ncbi:MAG: DegV family protein [Oscillospiraceae bacterium]|jgi:DegV family protein with EDD domain
MIRIITDSTCDISRNERKEMGITVVPLTINFNNHIYKDGYDLTNAEFYDMLASAQKLPTTSQINPGEFEETFSKFVEDGDEIVGIFISSELSGTVQSAHIAANAVRPERIFVVDSRSTTFGLALLLREAVRLRDEGRTSAAEIAKRIQLMSLNLKMFGVVDTLKYLKMGGRMSSGAAAIGGFLGILPVITLRDGRLELLGKARGDSGSVRMLAQMLKKYPPAPDSEIAFGNSAAPERMEKFISELRPLLGKAHIYKSEIGSVIGTHTGPGLIGIGYFSETK